ncbi:hypothetical protein [Mesorhizobium sp. KR9-304]|uniref:hypothetical protein n=1 Tax=Mesorhizobium sp. KR9-304 TaxID=3156614 RepID=UPI0032B47ACC
MNARFSEYVTSGAFNLALTRSQISALAMLSGDGESYLMSGSALERKGLVEAIPSGEDRYEFRLTPAGVLTLSLLFEAGLTNKGKDAVAAEVASLGKALGDANITIADLRKRLTSTHARLDEAEAAHADLLRCRETAEALRRCEEAGITLKTRPMIQLRDPLPGVPTADLVAGLGEAP